MSIDTTEPIGQVFYAADGGDDETGAGYYMKPCVHWFGKAPAADTKLYTTPQPAQATQVEVTDGIRPEYFTVDVVVKPMGGFASVNTQGVRVTHKPTGISVTCDAARSQHANRRQAFEKLQAILATPTAQAHPAEVTGEREAFESCALMEGSLFKRRADDPDKYWDGNVQDDWELWQAALRPAAVPMTDDEIDAVQQSWIRQQYDLGSQKGPRGFARAIEAHHGIIAKTKKDGA